MWNQALPASLPDSFEDEYALEIVYDAPEKQAAEVSAEEGVPRSGSAVKSKKGRPAAQHSPPASQAGSPYSGSPRTGCGGGAASAGVQQSLLGHEVHTLLQAVRQQPPQQQQQQGQEPEQAQPSQSHQQSGDWDRAAAAGPGAVATSQAYAPSQQQQQQQHQHAAEPSNGGALPTRRPRQPLMHNSPAVAAPTAVLPSAAAGAEQAPCSGGRRWRPAAAKVVQQAEPSGRHSLLLQLASQPPAAAPAEAGTGGAPFGGGWGAADQGIGMRVATVAVAQSGHLQALGGAAATRRRAGAGAAAPAASIGGRGGASGGGRAGFFNVDEDLLEAHMHMRTAGAVTHAGGGGWRQGGRRGKQAQQRQQSQMGTEEARQVPWGGASQAGPPAGLGDLPERQGLASSSSQGVARSMQGAAGGAGTNPLAALLMELGAGPRGKAPATTAKRQQHPIYGAGPAAALQQAKQPLTSPRQHRPHAHFSIKEAPASAPYGSNGGGGREQQPTGQAGARGAEGAAWQQGQQAQQAGVRMGVQQLTGRVPGSAAWHTTSAAALEGIDAGDDDWLEEERGRWQRQQPGQDEDGERGHQPPRGTEAITPGRSLPAHPAAAGHRGQQGVPQHEAGQGHLIGQAHHAPAEALGPGLGAVAPTPTSYKTPTHQLRQLFHRDTRGSSSAAADAAAVQTSPGAAAGAGPSTAVVPPGAVGASAARDQDRGAGSWVPEPEGGSAGGKGMSLQRQFVAALAPVSRPAAPPRAGRAASTGRLYGRLQAVAAAEEAHLAQHAQHGGRAGSGTGVAAGLGARLTVLERENEANLTKCICRLELLGAGPVGTAGGGPDGIGAGALAGAGVVVALFQSRTAREVDLVPGSAVVVRAGAWQALRVVGCELPAMLCHAVAQA